MDELNALEGWVGPLLEQLTPAARRAAAMDIARALRRSQQQRIAAQKNPDGSGFEPRKPRAVQGRNLRGKAGRIRRRAMFAKLRLAKLMKVETNAEGLAIGWAGRVARIARVHQEGLESEVGPGGLKYRYPVRQLLGMTQAEHDLIRDTLLDHLAR